LPLTGFRCPSNGESPGRDNSFDYCLTKCAQRCMPKAVLVKLRDNNVHNVHQGDMITPSALKGCTRKLVLERTEGYYEEPEKLYYAVRGALIHGFLENHGLNNVQTEVRLFKELVVNGKKIIISGQIDYYDGDEESIEDYKTMSDKGTFFLFKEGAKPEHVLQTNVYRWLCDGGRIGSLDGPQVFWPVKRIVIHMLFMNRVVSTGTTHIERSTGFKEPNFGKKYDLETWRGKVGENAKGVPVWEIHIPIPEVKLMPEKDVLAYIQMGAAVLDNGFQTVGTKTLPPGVLYNKNEAWSCDYCGVRDRCHEYELENNNEQFIKLTKGRK
jgi:hypothetical protein